MMLTLSLVAVLLYGMKSSGHEVVRNVDVHVHVCACIYTLLYNYLDRVPGGGHSNWNSLCFLLWLLAWSFKFDVFYSIHC